MMHLFPIPQTRIKNIDAQGFPVIYKTGKNTGFSRMHFWMILKRKPDYFVRTFLVPLVLLSILQVNFQNFQHWEMYFNF